MTGKTRNIHFHEGSYITFKSFSTKKKQHLKIIELTDSSFLYFPYENQHSIFDLQEVKFKDIKKIYAGGKKEVLGMKGVSALGGAGVFLIAFDVLNQISKPSVKINSTIAIISASLIGVSYIINTLQHPVYRINNKHSLKLYHIENPKLHP
ncbi:hypothetical protein [Arcicella rosea]|uniref:Putative membrane protein YkgB n=1 Tax=Arcicella rosea TaxID=502909 RepID=A0A841ESL6_9BACT|nr:hypothetical protein [Arcicella rosea]MBB6003250.1 putative membrane protein YkgB [Arcicella rosea]